MPKLMFAHAAFQFCYFTWWLCIRCFALYAPDGIRLARQKSNSVFCRLLVIAFVFLGLAQSATTATLFADPEAKRGEPRYYLSLVSRLEPGDVLYFPEGTYESGLDLTGLQGRMGAWITVTGPASGEPAVVTSGSNCCNVVQLDNSAFLTLMNLTIDSAGRDSVDGINAKGHPTHDISILGCTLLGQGAHQGTVGISTKSPAWNWTIRGNRIYRAGTGLYLGNSNGEAPFIAGVIDSNLIVDSIGYNLQIKHQNAYNDSSWQEKLPNGPRRTRITRNFFAKTIKEWPFAKKAGARPSVLVGTFPDEGPGSMDHYHIHGNVFYRNSEESLLQVTGKVAIHENLFLNDALDQAAIYVTDHNGPIKTARIEGNLIFSKHVGIQFADAPRHGYRVSGNMIFADRPLVNVSKPGGNLLDTYANAANYLQDPSMQLIERNFRPREDCDLCRDHGFDPAILFWPTDYASNALIRNTQQDSSGLGRK